MYRWWSISAVPLPCQSSCVKYPQPPQRVSRRWIFHLWRNPRLRQKNAVEQLLGFLLVLTDVCIWRAFQIPQDAQWAEGCVRTRCVVAFFRSKVAAAWRKLVVFFVYDGSAVEVILDCQQGSSITLHGLCSCILPWGGSEGQTGRPVTQKHAPVHMKTVRTKPIYRWFALTGHL